MFLLTSSYAAFSQQDFSEGENKSPIRTPDAPGNGNAATTQEIQILEEVIVTGQATPLLLRREMFRAQQFVYEKFNDLNTDDDYDMVCKKEARIGSQIRYRVCKPRITWTTESKRWSEIVGEDLELNVGLRGRLEDRKYRQQQREIMAEMANANPEFLQLLKVRLALSKAYEAEVGTRAKPIGD